MTLAHASAPGKIILFGEHAVVHGQPAIAVPLSAVSVSVDAEPAQSGAGLTIVLIDMKRTFSFRTTPPDDPLYNALILPVRIALHALACQSPISHCSSARRFRLLAGSAAVRLWPPR